ncbi:MAG: formate/nitrite transporter family protein [bacterium]|nr:formate/nitrite transporter family protein [bacterium]
MKKINKKVNFNNKFKYIYNFFNNKKKYLDYLIKGIYAGFMIGIGAVVYLSVPDKVIGSFLFSIGLLIVCMYAMNLFTGKIGYVLINKLDYLYEVFLGLIGNFIGAFIVGKLMLLTRYKIITEPAKLLVNAKLSDNLLSIFILSMFCGVLIYLAVNNYKKVNNEIGKYIGIFLCVMIFILCGFEHCVANMVYFTIASSWSTNTLLYLAIMILGNSFGSILIAFFYNLYYKN